MSITDQFNTLFKAGVASINIGLTPEGRTYVVAGQMVPTGPNRTWMQISHQVDGGDIPDMLNQISKQVEHANALKTEILRPPGRN